VAPRTASVPDLSELGRELAFRWRTIARMSAPPWKQVAGSWHAVETDIDAKALERLRRLRASYGDAMVSWPRILTAVELREAAYVLDLLVDVGIASPRPERSALDVGSKNGSNLPAFAAFAPGRWDLVEVDAHRRYATLSTRRAHGERVARSYPGSRFIAGSVLDLAGPYATITWILPFVDPAPHVAWGLPMRLYQPARLLAHVRELLMPGGTLIVVNQGEVERDLQGGLFLDCGMKAQSLGKVRSPLTPFKRPRFAWRWDKPASAVHSGQVNET
jgi:SAM-dependent methyltransferase